jgi:hypothetical protein
MHTAVQRRGSMTKIAWLFRMTDEAWRRHANPWSVWTRFSAIPAMIAAILEPGLDWLVGTSSGDRCDRMAAY